jgi:glycine cleavage system H protein
VSSHLVFLMGQFEARIPKDRRYALNHMWGSNRGGGVVRFGFTAYAVRLMLDVYFLDWSVAEPAQLIARQEIGAIESKKAESSLYSPVGGRLLQFNPELLSDPSAINLDTYGAGWLFEIEADFEELMSPESYIEFLAVAWENTRKKLRGQLG